VASLARRAKLLEADERSSRSYGFYGRALTPD